MTALFLVSPERASVRFGIERGSFVVEPAA